MTTAGFPANQPVQWQTWSPGPRDEQNEVTDVWAAPTDRLVISWSSDRDVTRDDGHVALDVDKVSLQIPAENFEWGVRDKVTLPGRGAYLVVRAEDGMGFHGWRPGLSLVLEKA
jgi:hypothetical protein